MSGERDGNATRGAGRGWVIGVDVGGTFTDLHAIGPDGRQCVHKLPSTPDDPSRAVIDGVR
ncbi:MAG: hypothetical protein KDK91_30145, partial [Gammaproteobacteria bacterium]|nr:hypothetical protein [Gammaproteobacteria bacterium]